MFKRIKKLWMEALRSGDYEQGASHLCIMENDGKMKHCCLGVLTELWFKEVRSSWEWSVEGLKTQKRKGSAGESMTSSYLPIEVANWAGLNEENPKIEPRDIFPEDLDYERPSWTLSDLNDHRLYSTEHERYHDHPFTDIADIIDRAIPITGEEDFVENVREDFE